MHMRNADASPESTRAGHDPRSQGNPSRTAPQRKPAGNERAAALAYRPQADHDAEVAQFAGNEHVYFFPEYQWMARWAGFRRIRVIEPAFEDFYSHDPIHLTFERHTLQVSLDAALGSRYLEPKPVQTRTSRSQLPRAR